METRLELRMGCNCVKGQSLWQTMAQWIAFWRSTTTAELSLTLTYPRCRMQFQQQVMIFFSSISFDGKDGLFTFIRDHGAIFDIYKYIYFCFPNKT